jgi:hypothetical protein
MNESLVWMPLEETGLRSQSNRIAVIYKSKHDGTTLSIRPDCAYLDLVWNGGVLSPLNFTWTPYEPRLPTLDFKLVNNSEKTLILTEIVLDVAQSIPDGRPVLLVRERRDTAGVFNVRNDGWGKVTNCRLSFELSNPDAEGNEPPLTQGQAQFLRLADFEDWIEVDMGAVLKQLGLDPLRFTDKTLLDAEGNVTQRSWGGGNITYNTDRGETFTLSTVELERRLAAEFDKFRSGHLILTGTFAYDAPNRLGDIVSYKSPITVPIWLRGELFAGASMPPSAAYHAKLEFDKTNYRVVIPISHSLQRGEADRFTLQLLADRSSSHSMVVSVYSSLLQVAKSPVELQLFKPRSWYRFVDLSQRDLSSESLAANVGFPPPLPRSRRVL